MPGALAWPMKPQSTFPAAATLPDLDELDEHMILADVHQCEVAQSQLTQAGRPVMWRLRAPESCSRRRMMYARFCAVSAQTACRGDGVWANRCIVAHGTTETGRRPAKPGLAEEVTCSGMALYQ